MKTFKYTNLSLSEKSNLLKRPAIDYKAVTQIVSPILNEIKDNGLSAALKYVEKFDGFSGGDISVEQKEIDEAETKITPKEKRAIDTAYENIYKFHIQQKPKSYEVETMPEVVCSREFRAITDVGLYIPGGSAILPSTLLMLGIPAQIAGCKRVMVCSPAKEGKLNPYLLYAAKKCGVNEIYKIGGAQAVGLMAYGDKSIKKASKIFGPGNQYVTAAKQLVSVDPDGCAIDLPAGPSEVLIIADENSTASFAAADLLSQAEHGADSQVVLICLSEDKTEQIISEVNLQLKELPRKEYAEKALKNSFALVADTVGDAFSFSNDFAPEHLILNIKNAHLYKDKVHNAGSVFLGQYSPESAGDYASGTNHSLPTYGYAKAYGGVTVEMFMKSMTFQHLTKEGLHFIAETVETLAEIEGLQAHKNAVSIRLKT